MTTRVVLLVAPAWVLLTACTQVSSRSIAGHSEAVVYGQDDRVDAYEAPELFSKLALQSTVAVIDRDYLALQPDGDFVIQGPSLGEAFNLCEDERFSAQPSVASCSGVLIAPDRVLAAGHCFGFGTSPGVECSAQRYVFGYALREGQAQVRVKDSDVYRCSRVLTRVVSPLGERCQWDFAVVELDRPVESSHAPAPIRTMPLEPGEPLAVIGFTSGLPVKIDLGAHVLDARREQTDYFTLDSDTFSVSSGSGVFDASGQLVGSIARGEPDWIDAGGCQRVHREAAAGPDAYESATNVAVVLDAIAAAESGATPQPCDVASGACTISLSACADTDNPVATAPSDACADDTHACIRSADAVVAPPKAPRVTGAGARTNAPPASASCNAMGVVPRQRSNMWCAWWLVACACVTRLRRFASGRRTRRIRIVAQSHVRG